MPPIAKGVQSMRYVMKQKIWSWADSFAIQSDEGGGRLADRFTVKGQVLSLGDKLSFCDMAGNELVFIRQKLLSWGPSYELQRAEGSSAAMWKAWTFFKDRFTVDVTADGDSPDDLDVQGDFWDHEYAFVRGGSTIADVSKQWFSWSDTYGVDIANGEDDVLILACTVIVDLCIERQQRR